MRITWLTHIQCLTYLYRYLSKESYFIPKQSRRCLFWWTFCSKTLSEQYMGDIPPNLTQKTDFWVIWCGTVIYVNAFNYRTLLHTVQYVGMTLYVGKTFHDFVYIKFTWCTNLHGILENCTEFLCSFQEWFFYNPALSSCTLNIATMQTEKHTINRNYVSLILFTDILKKGYKEIHIYLFVRIYKYT